MKKKIIIHLSLRILKMIFHKYIQVGILQKEKIHLMNQKIIKKKIIYLFYQKDKVKIIQIKKKIIFLFYQKEKAKLILLEKIIIYRI